MKILTSLVALLVISLSPVQAQIKTKSQSDAASTSTAQNAGNAQSIQFNSDSSGAQTIKSAPQMGSVGLFGSFSGDSCMVSAGAGVSIVGFGLQGAAPIQDERCSIMISARLIMQMAVSESQVDPIRAHQLKQAATDAVCEVNPTIGAALRRQGLCSPPESEQVMTTWQGRQTFAQQIEH